MPDQQSQQFEYLKEMLPKRIERLEASVNRYRGRFFITQMSTVVISGAVTTIAGIKGTWLPESVASNWILVLSAIITIVSAFGAFYAPRETWHLKAATQARLYALQNKLVFASKDPQFSSKEQAICQDVFDEYEKILTEHNQVWLELRKK